MRLSFLVFGKVEKSNKNLEELPARLLPINQVLLAPEASEALFL